MITESEMNCQRREDLSVTVDSRSSNREIISSFCTHFRLMKKLLQLNTPHRKSVTPHYEVICTFPLIGQCLPDLFSPSYPLRKKPLR